MAVWEDHLLARLTCKDAARLGSTCKALRGIVREHFKDLGSTCLDKLQAALTTFPRARTVATYAPHYVQHPRSPPMAFPALPEYVVTWDLAQSEALVEWLFGGGHGGGITTVVSQATMTSHLDYVNSFLHMALRRGALPSLKGVGANLCDPSHRAMLTEGRLGGMRELHLKVVLSDPLEPQLAALGLVRQLPALAKLELEVSYGTDMDPLDWPPFIPPCLKTCQCELYCVTPFSALSPTCSGQAGPDSNALSSTRA
jgi:hypothetical protein